MNLAIRSASQPIALHSAVAPAPAPASQPHTPPIEDAFEYAIIDTPEKAMQLTMMEPAFQMTLAFGALAGALMSGLGGMEVALSAHFDSMSGEVPMHGGYFATFGRDDDTQITGGGLVAGNFFSADRISADGDAVVWRSRHGGTETDLRLAMDEDQAGLIVSGNIGEVDAELKMGLLYNDEEEIVGFTTTGLLGDQSYNTELRLTTGSLDELANGSAEGQAQVRGSLGELEIAKDYTFSSSMSDANGDVSVALEGSGTNAGIEQTVSGRLMLREL